MCLGLFFVFVLVFLWCKAPKYSGISIKIYSNFNIYERILFQETLLSWCTRSSDYVAWNFDFEWIRTTRKNSCYPSIICQFLLRCSSMFKMKCNLLWNKNKHKHKTTTTTTATTATTTDTEETNCKLLQSVQWIAVILV